MASRNSDSAHASTSGRPRRLNDGVKQRIVGALVLVALAVIFLPSLLDREGVRYINVTSQIPKAPDIQPISIAEPAPVADVTPAPPVNEVFQPAFKESSAPAPDPDAPLATEEVEAPEKAVEALEKPESAPAEAEQLASAEKEAASAEKVPAPDTKLDAQGLPEGWVVQVAAYGKAESAERMRNKLLDAGFRAYTREVETAKGHFVRVFVGPKLERADAESEKRRLDKLLKTQTLVLRYKA